MKSNYTGPPTSAEYANFLFYEVDEDYFLRRIPFRDKASRHINDVLIDVAVDSGEQNSHKNVASTCVTPNVWCGRLYL